MLFTLKVLVLKKQLYASYDNSLYRRQAILYPTGSTQLIGHPESLTNHVRLLRDIATPNFLILKLNGIWRASYKLLNSTIPVFFQTKQQGNKSRRKTLFINYYIFFIMVLNLTSSILSLITNHLMNKKAILLHAFLFIHCVCFTSFIHKSSIFTFIIIFYNFIKLFLIIC